MVRLSCGVQVTRITLAVLNILFVLFGLALLGFGIYLKVSKKFDVALSDHINAQIIGGKAIETVGVILIITGIFTILLSVFGCIGALFKKRLFLYLYAVILTILMVLELAAFITLMSSRVRVRDSYQSGLWEVFHDAYDNDRQDIIKQIEGLELEFECCGVNDSGDYLKVNRTIPDSCYKDKSKQTIFDEGCADAIIDWIWDELPVIGGIVGAIIFIEIFGVIASISLGVAISHYSFGEIYGSV
ncbi:unnamed protein product [Rotaria socialis]|uniref:Tetraspanin n=1 Tax=Rotaria socialis TaxID=392032 RepID=A0A817MNG2_9BILA|nr:unnamed protein product [Rotaria socialis]CAF3335132.1 unnamed protein product [Rotaria socialis]CAF3356161.1 unnamed protein product [Rotaria socialis]CAF3453323.1 unnamed protein product [Rotaria socialis]CAF3533534.1 unnamed protein product [Rotaria socialis]